MTRHLNRALPEARSQLSALGAAAVAVIEALDELISSGEEDRVSWFDAEYGDLEADEIWTGQS